jgi:hypothetical protein
MTPYTARAEEIQVAQMKSAAVLTAAIARVPVIASATPMAAVVYTADS